MDDNLTLKLLLTCLNCDEPLTGTRRSYLYCSELCREEAKYVRYKRARIREGTVDDPEIQEALATKFSSILDGGYPEQERHLTSAQRAFVFARDGGRCRLCGAEATDIDHIGAGPDGDINHPDNLQLLCKSCHNEKTRTSLRQVTVESDPEEFLRCDEKWQELEQRIQAKDPERFCDDEQHWGQTWRVLGKARGDLMKDSRKH
jgi:hypothetical protein